MKKIIFLLVLTCNTICLFAQNDSSDNYVKRFVSIPAIKINIVPDSTVFTNQNLRKNEPFILMFFNPDCDHCQKEIKELMAYKEELKGIQILMVSPAPYPAIKDFYEAFGLSSMPDVRIGQDINYKLGSIYQLKTYPSTFVYDNRGILAKAFVGNIGIPALIDAVK
ncbi:MAG: TlpA disulfide reductase family protein [Ferruginibacter sp.]